MLSLESHWNRKGTLRQGARARGPWADPAPWRHMHAPSLRAAANSCWPALLRTHGCAHAALLRTRNCMCASQGGQKLSVMPAPTNWPPAVVTPRSAEESSTCLSWVNRVGWRPRLYRPSPTAVPAQAGTQDRRSSGVMPAAHSQRGWGFEGGHESHVEMGPGCGSCRPLCVLAVRVQARFLALFIVEAGTWVACQTHPSSCPARCPAGQCPWLCGAAPRRPASRACSHTGWWLRKSEGPE